MMRTLYRKLSTILDKREKRLAFFVLLLTICVALIEVLGVASLMPFMAVLANQDIIQTNSVLSYVYNKLGFESNESFLFFLGVVVLIMLVGSTFLRAVVVWAQTYYSSMRIYSISSRLVSGYLRKPYQWFLTNNSSKLAASIIEEVNRVVYGSLYPSLRLISHGLISILMIVLFLLVDPVLAISTAIFLGLTYGAIFKFASKRLAKNGKSLSTHQRGRHKAIQEAFGGIKDVKINGLEKSFLNNYMLQTRKVAFNSVSIKLWAEMPSFGMQALVFGGMMIIILYLMKYSSNLDAAIPTLALYALGGYKLMPSLQEIYKQLAQIKGNQAALDSVYEDVRALNEHNILNDTTTQKRLTLNDRLILQDISFSYPGTNKPALENINLEIRKNTTIGFVGGSGSGKTTTVDVILGLLAPGQGKLLADDIELNITNLRAWQNNLGYVPQQIFLTDDTISANIAFGMPQDKIDHIAVRKAAEAANLHEFIESDLPDGYNTHVGERGVRLSGGQRQRIGIARALYHDPDVLILDEATSALDNITEKAVMDAVKTLGHKKTILLVAHRLSTVQTCDTIFLFDKGKIIDSGAYNELIGKSQAFREMALLQNK